MGDAILSQWITSFKPNHHHDKCIYYYSKQSKKMTHRMIKSLGKSLGAITLLGFQCRPSDSSISLLKQALTCLSDAARKLTNTAGTVPERGGGEPSDPESQGFPRADL